MEQNRSYRSEATSDDNDTSTSSSSKKSATPRYHGAAYQPVEQPRSYDASLGGETPLPRAPLEAWIPLRNRIVQEQIDRRQTESKEDSEDTSTTPQATRPTPSVPQPRTPHEEVSFAESEQHRMQAVMAEAQGQPETASDDEDDDDDKAEHATTTVPTASQPTTHKPSKPHEQSSLAPEDHPEFPSPDITPPEESILSPHVSAGMQPEHTPVIATQKEHAFTPPEEGIPTLAIPEDVPTPQAAGMGESPLQQQWQSEAAPAFGGLGVHNAGEAGPQDNYNQPPLPPIKPPTETGGFAAFPEEPGYNPQVYRPYGHPGAGAAEYQPPTAQTVEYVPQAERRDSWKMPTLLMLGAVLYEGHRRRLGDRREASARAEADQELEKRFSAIANRRHEYVLRAQATTTEHIRELHTEQHHQVHEQQRLRDIQERFGAQPLMYGSERVQSVPTFAAERPVSAPEQHRMPEATPEGRPVAELTAEEALQQAQEQQERTRTVKSTWYETKVNAVTGQEVEGVIHGKGYHEERQQEIMRDRTGDATTDPVAASMGSYAVQAQGMPQYGTVPSLPSGMTSPALPPGIPTHVDAQHQLKAGDGTMRSNVTNPWFWLMLGLILAAFFTAALI